MARDRQRTGGARLGETCASGISWPGGGYRVRHDRISTNGNVTLRDRGRLHHIGIGRPYAGWRILLVAGRGIRILTTDGTQLRHLTLDPQHDYQPTG